MNITELEDLTECLFSESNDAFFIFHPSDGRLLEVNPTSQRLTGWRRKQLLTMRVTDVLEGSEPVHVLQFEDACRSTQFFHARDGYRLRQAAGSCLDVNISISRLHGVEETLGLLVVRDVTERKRSDDFRTAYQQVLEKLATGSRLEDVLTMLTQIAERQNPGMQCSLLLLDENRSLLRLGAAPSLPEEYQRTVEGIEIGQGFCGVAACTPRRIVVDDIQTSPLWDGWREMATRHHLRSCWSQPILSSSGQILGIFVMYYADVRAPADFEIKLIETAAHVAGISIERHNTELAFLRQQAQLGHVTRLTTVGELAAGIAHEVTQPASAIINFASACATIMDENPSAALSEARGYLDEIRGAAYRIGEIVDRLRAFVKGTAPHRSSCELRPLIQEVLMLLAAELQRHNVTVQLDLCEESCPLLVDRIQLQQVFVNLIMNACDAIDDTSRRRGTIWITSWLVGTFVHITIEDSGAGLPPRQAERVFEPFFTTKKHGIGIGLSICKTIVEVHGGQIQITTPTRGGSAFHVRLPTTASHVS